MSPLAVGANGMVYGATMDGGYGWGVLFADQRSSEWTFWNFTGDPAHGRGFPIDILLGTDGCLYGLAFADGIGYPAIFFTYP